jgi:hypothetical protein
MLRLRNVGPLTGTTLSALDELQQEVNDSGEYPDRVTKAKLLSRPPRVNRP